MSNRYNPDAKMYHNWFDMNELLKEIFEVRIFISTQNLRIQKLEECIKSLVDKDTCTCINFPKVNKSRDIIICHNPECKMEPKACASVPCVLSQHPCPPCVQEKANYYPEKTTVEVSHPVRLDHMHGDLVQTRSKYCIKTSVFHEYDVNKPARREWRERCIQTDSRRSYVKHNDCRGQTNLKISTYVNTDLYPKNTIAIDKSTQYYVINPDGTTLDDMLENNLLVEDYALVEDSDFEK